MKMHLLIALQCNCSRSMDMFPFHVRLSRGSYFTFTINADYLKKALKRD